MAGDSTNIAHSSSLLDFLLHAAADNGSKSIQSVDSKTILHCDPRSVQTEIKTKISHAGDINNVSYTRNVSIIFSTSNVECASEICQLSKFLGVSINHHVIWENMWNKFLIFNIPEDILLAEIAQEISTANHIKILKLRRFLCKVSQNTSSQVPVTSPGTNLPHEIKLRISLHFIRQFIDRPQQCNKCFKFNHSSEKCNSEQICVTCSLCHTGTCTSPVRCSNYGGNIKPTTCNARLALRRQNFWYLKAKYFYFLLKLVDVFHRNLVLSHYPSYQYQKIWLWGLPENNWNLNE